MENSDFRSLHHCHVHKLWSYLNRTYSLLHMLALAAIFYYRGVFFFNKTDVKYHMVPHLLWLLIFAAELVLSFLWLLRQPFYWRCITRSVFPENLPNDEELPGIDVFICTADPNKEPTLDVMNTVISAMALDYPAKKLAVYLSDDAGASVTLDGMKLAWIFATWWLPFCKRYNIKQICPQAYFQNLQDENQDNNFTEERKLIQEKYEIFEQEVRNKRDRGYLHGDAKKSSKDRAAIVQVINGSFAQDDAAPWNPEQAEMPLLVYVAREKRESFPHHFKAGALNALLRVSSILSNSQYILVLDCDMYCNDSISARQAMCFYLDSKISPSLGWVQYPQKFHNINKSDISDSQLRILWAIFWYGADGLQGPLISGTNFYIRRKALYGVDMVGKGNDLKELRETLGSSNEFITSLHENEEPRIISARELPSILLEEAHFLASCIYEKDTKWGTKVGFWYDTIMEDVMTGLYLQSKGWRSVYLNPARPQFLGSATTNFNDIFSQGIRWYSGFLDLALSKRCPLINYPSRMPFLQKMSCSYLLFDPLHSLPILCFATILPLCFLYGIPLYPQVSDPFFMAFSFAFLSSVLKHLCDTLLSGGSVSTWLNEQRMWLIKSFTGFLYGVVACVLTRLGFQEASFTPTNKAGDADTYELYQMGKYDFRTSNMFLVPIVTAVILNIALFVGGLAKVIVTQDWDALCAQVFLSFYSLLMSLPVIEAMILRKDSGRIPLSATLISASLSVALLSFCYLILSH